jgi:hypothetical protein
MKKKRAGAVLSLPEFRIRFLRVLESNYAADATIAGILKDQAIREQCAVLLWLTENDARERLTRLTTRGRDLFTKAYDAAIPGLKAAEFLYLKQLHKPLIAEALNSFRSELLLNRPVVDLAFPSPKEYGTNRDWSIVRYAKEKLELLLKTSISNRVMADLLTAAAVVVGRRFKPPKTGIDEGDVEARLRGLNLRTFERLLPHYRQMLAEHYPQGTDSAA